MRNTSRFVHRVQWSNASPSPIISLFLLHTNGECAMQAIMCTMSNGAIQAHLKPISLLLLPTNGECAMQAVPCTMSNCPMQAHLQSISLLLLHTNGQCAMQAVLCTVSKCAMQAFFYPSHYFSCTRTVNAQCKPSCVPFPMEQCKPIFNPSHYFSCGTNGECALQAIMCTKSNGAMQDHLQPIALLLLRNQRSMCNVSHSVHRVQMCNASFLLSISLLLLHTNTECAMQAVMCTMSNGAM